MAYAMRVVEIGTGVEHEIPADAATRDAPTLARPSALSGPVVPLVFRPADAAFYLSAIVWPELAGKLLRRCA